jgi:hypothetical protein
MADILIAAQAATISKEDPATANLLLRLDAADTASQVEEALGLYDMDSSTGSVFIGSI